MRRASTFATFAPSRDRARSSEVEIHQGTVATRCALLYALRDRNFMILFLAG
jgi:hypothetical protein